jgi:hypothetical protein
MQADAKSWNRSATTPVGDMSQPTAANDGSKPVLVEALSARLFLRLDPTG